MRPTLALLLTATLTAGLSACTFVPIQPGGQAIRVVPTGQPLNCEKRGEIVVSVKDRLGPLQRNELRVRDELEVLARNEAPGLGADTLQALQEPLDGEQRWAAYRCGAATGNTPAAHQTRPEPPLGDEAEVLPLRDP